MTIDDITWKQCVNVGFGFGLGVIEEKDSYMIWNQKKWNLLKISNLLKKQKTMI